MEHLLNNVDFINLLKLIFLGVPMVAYIISKFVKGYKKDKYIFDLKLEKSKKLKKFKQIGVVK